MSFIYVIDVQIHLCPLLHTLLKEHTLPNPCVGLSVTFVTCVCVCVFVSVRALKGQRFELPTPKLVQM